METSTTDILCLNNTRYQEQSVSEYATPYLEAVESKRKHAWASMVDRIAQGKNVMEVGVDEWVARGKHRGTGTCSTATPEAGLLSCIQRSWASYRIYSVVDVTKILFLAGYRFPLVT